jgi:hypothetical protein
VGDPGAEDRPEELEDVREGGSSSRMEVVAKGLERPDGCAVPVDEHTMVRELKGDDPLLRLE